MALPTVDPAESENGLPLPRRIWAIIAVCFGTALFVLDGSIANVALPTIARDLRVEEGAVVNVVTVYQLVMVMTLLPMANLGERFGLRHVYQTGQTLFLLASLATLLVHSLTALLLVRALQAFGAGMALSVSTAQIRAIYPRSRLGSGLAINTVIVASSNSLAPVLGGFLAGHDWRMIFVAAVPFAVLSLLLGHWLPQPRPHISRESYDWRAGLWTALNMALLVGGMELATHADAKRLGLGAVAAGLVSTVLLVRSERKQRAPVLPVDLLAQPIVGLSVLAAVAGFVATAALTVALPFRLEQEMGFAPRTVGLLMLPFPLTMLVVAPAAGWLSDRISASLLGVTGTAIAAIGLLLLAIMPHHASAFGIAWRLSLTALGFGLFFAPNARMIIGSAPRHRAAAAGSLVATGRLSGQTLGAATVGVLLTMGLGRGALPMVLGGVLAVLAGLCSFTRYRVTRVHPA